jgi:hypothetical protein
LYSLSTDIFPIVVISKLYAIPPFVFFFIYYYTYLKNDNILLFIVTIL